MYEESVSNNDSFWSEHGKRIDWFKPYTKKLRMWFIVKIM